MKKFNINKKFAAGCIAIALAAIVGTVSFQVSQELPELPVVQPTPEGLINAEPDNDALAGPKVTTKTTKKTKTNKKKVKLKSASKKTYTKNLGTKTKKSSKTVKNGNTTVKTDTTVATATTEKYTKKSKTKEVTEKITTTTKVTTTVMPTEQAASQETAQTTTKTATNDGTGTVGADSQNTETPAGSSEPYEVSVRSAAPRMDERILRAYEALGFKVIIDPSVSYSGYFNAKNRTITLKKEGEDIYHELGHFAAFMGGNVDKSSSFTAIFNEELNTFPGENKVYASQNTSEFYAECMRLYILDKANLAARCPKTTAAIEKTLDAVTDSQIAKYKKVYAAYWQ
jgi:hypothetical protein